MKIEMTCKWVLFSAYYAYNFFFPVFFLFWDMWGLLKMAMHACFAISGQQIFFFWLNLWTTDSKYVIAIWILQESIFFVSIYGFISLFNPCHPLNFSLVYVSEVFYNICDEFCVTFLMRRTIEWVMISI